MMSDETRRDLKIWEILELFLSAKEDKASIVDFQSFLSFMEIDATPQAVDPRSRYTPNCLRHIRRGGTNSSASADKTSLL